ncbi:MAG: hypothetical protein KDJ22_15780 [Candidatus Competibacteraceae bacterium]|nr:hypothetical protein [Candidatus Competibacteraceae bacterium]
MSLIGGRHADRPVLTIKETRGNERNATLAEMTGNDLLCWRPWAANSWSNRNRSVPPFGKGG